MNVPIVNIYFEIYYDSLRSSYCRARYYLYSGYLSAYFVSLISSLLYFPLILQLFLILFL